LLDAFCDNTAVGIAVPHIANHMLGYASYRLSCSLRKPKVASERHANVTQRRLGPALSEQETGTAGEGIEIAKRVVAGHDGITRRSATGYHSIALVAVV
jgi:hypothetical protein